jgi:carbon storage regulator
MLVLSRKLGEAVVIGGTIRLTVVAIRGNQIRLGITAPPEVAIRREELARATGPSREPEPPTGLPARAVGGGRTTPPAGGNPPRVGRPA